MQFALDCILNESGGGWVLSETEWRAFVAVDKDRLNSLSRNYCPVIQPVIPRTDTDRLTTLISHQRRRRYSGRTRNGRTN